jgi:opacity protein-like surface antigen
MPFFARSPRLPRAAALAAGLGLGVAGLAVPAAAQEDAGPYIGARGLVGLSDAGDLELSTGRALDLDDDSREISVGGSAVVGWRFEGVPIRAEIEYIWRYRFDIDARTAAPVERVKSNIDTHSIYVNAYWDIPISLSFRGYLGAGIGAARHNADTQFIGAGGTTTSIEDADTQVTWMATAGLQYDLSEAWVADLSYRYSDLGEIQTPTGPIGALEGDSYDSHDFLFGLTYRF